ncbi:LPD38 domain-containing protein [Pseudomonas chengduensis]
MADLLDEFGLGNSPSGGSDLLSEFGLQPEAPKASGIVDTVVEGAKNTGRAIASTVDAYTGNTQGVADRAAEQAQAPRDPRLEQFQADYADRTAALGEDPGLLPTIGQGIGAIVDNPAGAGLAVLEQLPNAAAVLGGGWAGLKGGAAIGAGIGSVVPGVGTAAGGTVGGVVGGLAGMFLGNTALETGNKAMAAADDGEVTQEELAQARREGAVKGGVITGVDALTLGVGGKVASTLQRTSSTALEAATRKTLMDRGVDVTSEAAVVAARANPEIAAAVRVAQDNARKATDRLGRRVATGGALLGMETVGEGVGEYLGELAATGEGNIPDAVLESLLSLGQSTAEASWNMARTRMVQPSPSAENPMPAPVPAPDPAAGVISRTAAQLPAPDRLALPAPEQILYADANGQVSEQGPARNVDREQRPVPGREAGQPGGGPGMDQQTPRGELPITGEVIPAARMPQAQPPATQRTFDAEPVRQALPDLRPEAVVVDSAGQAQVGRVPNQPQAEPAPRVDGLTAQAVPGQRPKFDQVLQQARQTGEQADAETLAASSGATRAQAARAIKAVRDEQQAVSTIYRSVPGANKALRSMPEPAAFEVVKSGNREWRIQRRQEVQGADSRPGPVDDRAAGDTPAVPDAADNVAREPVVAERPAAAVRSADAGGTGVPATAPGADGQRALSEQPAADQPAASEEAVPAQANDQAPALPEILATPRKRYIDRQAKAAGIKKGSPGYDQAIQRLQDQYEADVDRASAGITFEQFNELNSDSPEGVNRQAWEALRQEFGQQQYSRNSYRRAPEQGQGARAGQLRMQLKRLTGAWQNAPGVKVVQSIKDLPDRQRRQVERDGAFDVEGIFADGQVYLVADNLRDAQHAAFVLQHEVLGHAGLQGAYGQRLTPLLMSIYNGNPEMKAQADTLVRRFGYKPAVAMEEVLADMAGAGTIQQQAFWPRLVTAMRNALRSIGFNMRWTEGDIQGLLANARRYIERGKGRGRGRTVFSRNGNSGRLVEMVDEQGRLLAPNGKPSKLTQKQWHQARSDNFKRWFGDWQAMNAQERLDAMKPLKLRTPESWKDLTERERLAKVEESLKGMARQSEALPHDDLGEVTMRMSGAKKASSSAADPAKQAILARLQQAFEHSIYASGAIDQDAPTMTAYHKLLAPIDVDGVPLVAVFTVREDANGRMFYNTVAVDRKEEAPAVSPGDMSENAQRSTPANTRAPSSFLRRQLKRVNGEDVSAVTDGNGEPLVLHHGTGEQFSIFDQGRAGLSTGHTTAPLGIFLTSDAELAQAYAVKASDGMPGLANVMPLFASIKKPYRMSVAESQALDTPEKAIAFRQQLEREGYDGVQLVGTPTWVAFYNNQVKSATNNTGAFDEIDPDIRYSRASQRDTEALRKLGLAGSEAQNLLDQVRSVTLGGLQAKLKEWSVRSEEGIFDGLAGIRRAEEAVGVTDANQQGYVSARLASGIADVMHGVLHYAAPEWRDNIVSGKAGTRGVLDILGDLGADNLTPWLAWLGGKRAQLLKAQGRENNLTDTEIAELVAMGQGKEELFEKVYREYAKVNEAVLDLAQEAGLIDQDARAKWLTDYYVPFYRQDESEGIFTAPRSKRGLSHQTAAIKALKGGNLPTNDLLSNMLAGWTKRIDASMKNKALLEVVDNLQGSDYLTDESPRWQQVLISRDQIAQQIRKDRKALALAADLLDLPAGSNVIKVVNQLMKPESEGFEKLWTRVAPTDPDIVRVQRDGKSEYYRVNDESLLRGLKFMEGSVFNDPITKIGRTFKRILTTGVTASPDFILRNFIRDAAHAWVINKDGFTLGKDSLKGMRDALREDQDYRDLMFAGGSFQGGYVHGADPEASAQIIRRALEKKGFTRTQQEAYLGSLVNTPAKAAAMLGKGWQKYRELGDKVENANRLSTYKAAIEAGKSRRQASYEAKDLMDYSLRGNFAAAQWFTDVVPFLNARLQGLYKLGRAVKGDKTLLAKEVAMKGGYIALFSLMLAGLNDDDERYQALMDWDKDMHWHIFLGDEHFRIPKPFELGLIFGTVPERILHALTGTQDGGDLAKAVSRGVFDTLAFNPVPQFYQPIRELQANRNFFRDSPIEDMSDEGKLAEARYDERTSAIGRALGQVTGPIAGLSPKQVDHLIAAYTGTLGQYVLDMSSLVANSLSDAERPASRSGDIPILKVLYQGDSPRSTKYQSEFYDMMREADQLNRTIKAYREEGRVDAAEQLMAANREKLRHRPALGFARKQLGNVRNQMDAVYRDTRMTPEQKRQRLDALQRQSNEIAERIVKLAGGDF